MSIGTNIKRIRREKGITQEKLADLLGLTPSAISQWETDRVLPDITQLPLLCNIFDVTADEILGISNETKMQEIYSIEDEAHEMFNRGEYDNSVDIIKKGLQKYPDSYLLMEWLIFYLDCKDRKGTVDERIELCIKVLDGAKDEYLKNRVTADLCLAYAYKGENDKALELANNVVEMSYTRDDCREFALRNTLQWVDESCVQADKAFNECVRHLSRVARVVKYRMNDDEAIELWRKIIIFIETYYEKGDYTDLYIILLEGCCDAAHRSASLGKYEQAVYYLKKMVSYIKEIEHYFVDPNKRLGCSIRMPLHTSLVPHFDESYAGLLHTVEVDRFAKKAYEMLAKKEFSSFCEMDGVAEIEVFLKDKCEQLEAYIKVNCVEDS